MGLEQSVNQFLNRMPGVKKVIKRAYQLGMYTISPKIKSEGNITRVSPNDPNHEYFFGYYDKSPWDASDRYMLCLKANNTWSDVSPKEEADILLIDTQDDNKVKVLAKTRAWNVQQSCMLQWFGPDYSSKIIYNDFRDGKYCSVILNIDSGEEKVIPVPIYSVSADGRFALTLDFSRLYNLRPGYGYYNEKEVTEGVALPDTTAIWRVDIESGEVTSILKYTDFANFEPRTEMKEKGSVHKVNHIMLSPNGKRFMVLYRWFNSQRKYTRLITCNVDGTDMYVLSDDDMVSHCFWKDDNHIFGFENKKDSGAGYYLMKDKTQEYEHYWPVIDADGHPSYSPDGSKIIFDTYPDRARIASVKIATGPKDSDVKTVARVFAPFRYDNDTRCDLHPRWSRDGKKVCFDAVFEGHRGLYVVSIDNTHNSKLSIITPFYNTDKLKYQKLINSLNHQTIKEFEWIIIDDCSDNVFFQEFNNALKNCNFSYRINRNFENRGAGKSREVGIKEAKGEYIVFVDSDDFVSDDFVEQILDSSVYKCDVIAFDFGRIVNDSVKSMDTIRNRNKGIIDKYEVIGNITSNVCGKAIKTKLIRDNEIKFLEIPRFEDWAFITQCIGNTNSVYYIKKVLYYYVDNPNSSVHRYTDATSYARIAFTEIMTKLDLSKKILDLLYTREVIYVAIKQFCNCDDLVVFENKMIEIRQAFPIKRIKLNMDSFSIHQNVILGLYKLHFYRILRFLIHKKNTNIGGKFENENQTES